jgi:hypothetical protein
MRTDVKTYGDVFSAIFGVGLSPIFDLRNINEDLSAWIELPIYKTQGPRRVNSGPIGKWLIPAPPGLELGPVAPRPCMGSKCEQASAKAHSALDESPPIPLPVQSSSEIHEVRYSVWALRLAALLLLVHAITVVQLWRNGWRRQKSYANMSEKKQLYLVAWSFGISGITAIGAACALELNYALQYQTYWISFALMALVAISLMVCFRSYMPRMRRIARPR